MGRRVGEVLNDEPINFKVDCFFGRKELKQFYNLENGWLVCYGYSISYDIHGNEISRTEPTALSAIFFG